MEPKNIDPNAQVDPGLPPGPPDGLPQAMPPKAAATIAAPPAEEMGGEGGFSYPKEAAGAVKNASQISIGLPFDVSVFFVRNGRPDFAQLGGVQHRGGWNCADIPEAGMVVTDIDGKEHTVTHQTSIYPSGEDTFNSIDFQQLLFAPIVYRKRWYEGRSHTQYFGIVNLSIEPGFKTYIPTFAILTAKGFQAGNILDAIGSFASKTAQLRRALGNPPPFFFWHAIGTALGDGNPDFKTVGKPPNTSTITPIRAYPPNQKLERYYVGHEMARRMGMVAQDEEVLQWRDTWADAERAAKANQGGEAPAPNTAKANQGGGYGQPNYAADEDLPF